MKSSNTCILAENVIVENDIPGFNANHILIGSPGSGKTTSYIWPNLKHVRDNSFILADTKGNLYDDNKDQLRKKGYDVYKIDLKNPGSGISYNPLNYVETEQDIISLSSILIPILDSREPFWEMNAQICLQCLIAYVMEAFDTEDRNLATVSDVFKLMCNSVSSNNPSISFLEEHSIKYPDSFAARKYESFKSVLKADRTWSCVCQFVSTAISIFDFTDMRKMLSTVNKFKIEHLGTKKTALFINTSDIDHSLDRIVAVIYQQIIQTLCRAADNEANHRLRVPCRLIFDDFAASGCTLHDFDQMLSVMRSRQISVTLILQSITQLESAYGHTRAQTIITNCDTLLFLGTTDLPTVNYIAERIGKTTDHVLHLPLEKAYLLRRGERRARIVNKICPYLKRDCQVKPTEDKTPASYMP